jgi:hypothetical protein
LFGFKRVDFKVYFLKIFFISLCSKIILKTRLKFNEICGALCGYPTIRDGKKKAHISKEELF